MLLNRPELAVPMRVICFSLSLALCLSVAACGGPKQGQGRPPLDKDMLPGKWEADSPEQFIQFVEFKDDQSFTMRIKDVPEAVPGKYAWSGDYSLSLEYQPPEETRKVYQTAIKQFKEKVADMAKQKGGPIGDNMLQSATRYPDELPAREEMRVNLSEDRHGQHLNLATEKGLICEFLRPK